MKSVSGGFLAVLGYKIVDFFTNKTTSTLIVSSVFLGIFLLLPIDIRIPYSIYKVVVSEDVVVILNTIALFFPVNFILACFLFIMLCRHAHFLYKIYCSIASWLMKGLGQ